MMKLNLVLSALILGSIGLQNNANAFSRASALLDGSELTLNSDLVSSPGSNVFNSPNSYRTYGHCSITVDPKLAQAVSELRLVKGTKFRVKDLPNADINGDWSTLRIVRIDSNPHARPFEATLGCAHDGVAWDAPSASLLSETFGDALTIHAVPYLVININSSDAPYFRSSEEMDNI